MKSAAEYRAVVHEFFDVHKDPATLKRQGLPVGGRSNALPTMKSGAARKYAPRRGDGADGGARRPH